MVQGSTGRCRTTGGNSTCSSTPLLGPFPDPHISFALPFRLPRNTSLWPDRAQGAGVERISLVTDKFRHFLGPSGTFLCLTEKYSTVLYLGLKMLGIRGRNDTDDDKIGFEFGAYSFLLAMSTASPPKPWQATTGAAPSSTLASTTAGTTTSALGGAALSTTSTATTANSRLRPWEREASSGRLDGTYPLHPRSI